MNTRYVYNPEIEYIYLYKGQPVIMDDPAYGYVTIWTLNRKFIDAVSQYTDEIEKAYNRKLGKIIRPRWDKQVQTWETVRRGLTKHERNLYR